MHYGKLVRAKNKAIKEYLYHWFNTIAVTNKTPKNKIYRYIYIYIYVKSSSQHVIDGQIILN